MIDSDLQALVADWDGKSAESITKVYSQFHAAADFTTQLVAMLQHEPLQRGATWLLKRWLEAGGEISAEDIQTYYSTAPILTHWESRLHLLQSLQYLPITAEQAASLYPFIQRCLGSKKTFVRAWAYSGMYELAKQHPDYRSETDALFIKANATESASIRARIRQVSKVGYGA